MCEKPAKYNWTFNKNEFCFVYCCCYFVICVALKYFLFFAFRVVIEHIHNRHESLYTIDLIRIIVSFEELYIITNIRSFIVYVQLYILHTLFSVKQDFKSTGFVRSPFILWCPQLRGEKFVCLQVVKINVTSTFFKSIAIDFSHFKRR